jgi:ribonuclease III
VAPAKRRRRGTPSGRGSAKPGAAPRRAARPVARRSRPAAPAVPPIADFEARLGHAFRDRARLEAAWVHRSAAHERKVEGSYERLEFLGDAVLGLIAADWLYRGHPDLPEGELSRLKSALVSAETLARYARELGLGDHLVVGQGEERSGGRAKTSLLADSLEAVIAAVFLDGGLRAARQVVERFLRDASRSLDLAAPDAKSALQERIQALGREAPTYRVCEESGPDHAKTFTVEVVIGGEVAGRGTGRSKKAAELDAARQALAEGATDEPLV